MTALDFGARALAIQARRQGKLLERKLRVPLPIRTYPLRRVMASPPAFTSGTAATLTGQKFLFHGFRFEVAGRKDNRITRLKIRPLEPGLVLQSSQPGSQSAGSSPTSSGTWRT